MSGATLEYSEMFHLDEGVIMTRSGDGIFVRLPDPSSVHHQLCVIAVLWKTWLETSGEVFADDLEWNIIVSAPDELTLPLVTIMGSIDAELKQSGRKLVVLEERSMTSSARARTAT